MAEENGTSQAKQDEDQNPAGNIDLTEEDLESVSGGTITFDCTGSATYCQGTCCLPTQTYGCCYS